MGAIRRAHKSPDYHMGYSDGFNAGVQHAQKFIESQAQPNVVIALPANSQPQAAADVVLARKLIEAVEAVSTHAGDLGVHSNTLRRKSAPEMKEDVLAALRDTCKKLGVNVDGRD